MLLSSLRQNSLLVRRLGLLVLAFAGACEGDDLITTGGDGAVADAGERGDDTLLPAAGMYHLPDTGNATTLELTSDGKFRWYIVGCDFSTGDIGRWIVEDGEMVLLPRTGDRFLWRDGSNGFVPHVRVVLRRNAALNRLDAELHQLDSQRGTYAGSYEQSWFPGGWCAECGPGQAGGSIAYACDDPFAESGLDF